MEFPWAILISVVVLIAAILLKWVFVRVVEEDHVFKLMIAGFFILFAAASVGIYLFSPPIQEGQIRLESVTQPLSLFGE